MRKCHVCKVILLNPEPWRWRCKECGRLQAAEARKRDPEKYNRHAREYARRNGKRLRWELKLELIEEYGGKCACCGEASPEFLTIDHIDGSGAEHRRQIKTMGTGVKFYGWLKARNWPKDNYRLLCFNCNAARHLFKVCPHQRVWQEHELRQAKEEAKELANTLGWK